MSQNIKVHYSPVTGEWRIDGKSAAGVSDVNAYNTYGTQRMNAYKILENALNLRDVRVYDKVVDVDGTERRVLNSKETTNAQQKQQVIKDALRTGCGKTSSDVKRWWPSTTSFSTAPNRANTTALT